MIHLYAFVHGRASVPAASGLAGARLESVDVDGITAIFSRHDGGELGPTRDLALVHGTVITRLDATDAEILPVRFGERFDALEDLCAAVRERRSTLEASFARVRGCAEIGLRVVGGEPEQPRAASGTEYMRRIRASGIGPAQELHQRLQALSRDVRISAGGGDRLSAAYLVPRSRLDEIRDTVETWTTAHPDITAVCTGPWAPFSFASEAA